MDGAPTKSHLHIMCAIPHSDGHVFWRVALVRLEIHIQGQLLRSTQRSCQSPLDWARGTCGTHHQLHFALERYVHLVRLRPVRPGRHATKRGCRRSCPCQAECARGGSLQTKHTHCQNVSLLLSRNISTPLPGFADVTVHTGSAESKISTASPEL